MTRHKMKGKKTEVFLTDIDISMTNILIELTPSTMIHLCSLLNPFEYFYHSSLDSALPNFKQFVHDSYKIPEVEPVTPPKSQTIGKILIGDIKISKIPLISMLIYLFKNENLYLQTLYQAHIGDYVSQNHFINEHEYLHQITPCNSSSYAYDMLIKSIQTQGTFKGPLELSLLSNYALFVEIKDLGVYYEPNIHELILGVREIGISVVEGNEKIQVGRIGDLEVNNVKRDQTAVSEGLVREMRENSGLEFKVRQDSCFIINEEEDEELEDEIANKLDELNILFEKKKSHCAKLTNSGDVNFKQNYLNIDFKGGIYVGVSNSNLNSISRIVDSLLKHLFGIKALFYTANT